MVKATDKQCRLMDKLGIEYDEDISKFDASKLIDKKLSEGKKEETHDTEWRKRAVGPEKPKFDTSSYYVAYAKDIVCSLIESARKLGVTKGAAITDVNLMTLMGSAVAAVKMAKEEFS